ncbi:MAG: iron-sulfur cluster repair di-iron protein [Lewinellaceae bacterium]|nr:iron-sulfur cluster repair di-iron protein [Lewinellaceae bacterium]
MTLHPERTIGELVAHHYRTAEVFSRHGIDFCCGGKRTLAKACAEKELAWETLSDELTQAIDAPEMPSQNTDKWAPDFLAEYIVQTHHQYLREALPLLRRYTAKIAGVHGSRHPELKVVEKQVELLAGDLLEHIDKEEHILFPYIKALCVARREHTRQPKMPFGSVENPIHVMENEHDYAGTLLENLRDLTNGFTPPADACATYIVTFSKLEELDNDLRWHVHLENNVLFPKVLLLEKLLEQQN